MLTSSAANVSRTLFDSLGAWWRKRRERAATLAGLRASGEFARIARDIGMSAAELRVLAGKWPDDTGLVMRRAAALGLDMPGLERTHPRVVRDLERVCSLCGSRRACAHDLARNPGDPVWRDGCPNADTFAALAECGKNPS